MYNYYTHSISFFNSIFVEIVFLKINLNIGLRDIY